MYTQFESFRAILNVMDEQRRREREQVRAMLTAAPTPVPVGAEVLCALCQLNPGDARDVLRDHPGYALSERLESYDTARAVFERSIADLIRAISDFENRARDASLFDRARRKEKEDAKARVQKELFATANATHALKDHSTNRLQKEIQVPHYDEKLRECFGDDGLHDFVIGLRAIIHHVQMVQPGLTVTRHFDGSDNEVSFRLDKEALLLVVDGPKSRMPVAGREYLRKARQGLDLRHVFEEYARRASSFHAWFRSVIDSEPLPALRDYQRCIKEITNTATRVFWRAMLGNWLNWAKPPNPHDHLPRFLSPEQIEEAYRLPMNSHEQVDYIISIVDRSGACDDELRGLFYQLFERAEHPAAPTKT